MQKSKFRNRFATIRGFTLIELLIVISLIGVIALFSWQALYRFGGSQELKNTALSIVALSRDAQQRSITQVDGRSWGVRFENGSQTADGRGRYFLFSTSQSLTGPITDWTTGALVTLKPVLKFNQPAGIAVVAFQQISGDPALIGCPGIAAEEIEVGLINSSETAIVKIYCNGRVEY